MRSPPNSPRNSISNNSNRPNSLHRWCLILSPVVSKDFRAKINRGLLLKGTMVSWVWCHLMDREQVVSRLICLPVWTWQSTLINMVKCHKTKFLKMDNSMLSETWESKIQCSIMHINLRCSRLCLLWTTLVHRKWCSLLPLMARTICTVALSTCRI